MKTSRISLLEIAICAYCAWHSFDLVHAWQSAPFERFAWVALLIWSIPVVLILMGRLSPPKASPARPLLLGTGLLSSLLGSLGSLNVLQHIGLAMALGALLPWSWRNLPWLIAAISWMPALGWLGSRYFAGYVLPARFFLAVLASGWVIYQIHRAERKTLTG